MIKNKYSVVTLVGALSTVTVAANNSTRDWDDVLESFENYKNDLIMEKSKAVVNVFGEKIEEVSLKEPINMSSRSGDIKFFSCWPMGVVKFGNEKSNDKPKESNNPQVKCEKRTKLTTRGLVISKDGYIIAPYSSVQSCKKLYVRIGKKKYNVIELLYDEYYDIALLKIKAESLPFVAVSNLKQKINKNNLYPLTSDIKCLCTTTVKSIEDTKKEKNTNAKGRKEASKRNNNTDDKEDSYYYIQSYYNSLSDTLFLINSKGALVGMTVGNGKALNNRVGMYSNVLEAGDIEQVVKVLKFKKQYTHDFGGLGVVNNDTTFSKKRMLGVNTGCVIVSLDEARRKDGFLINDVIIRINDRSVNNIFDLYSIFNVSRSDDMIFTVLRKEKEEEITVQGGSMSSVPFKFVNGVLTTKGYTFSRLSSQQRTLLRKNQIFHGVMMRSNSPDDKTKRDFVVTNIDHVIVDDVDSVKKYFKNLIQQYSNKNVKSLRVLVEGYYLNDLSEQQGFSINLL